MYRLEKYSGIQSRYACPSCGKPRKFTRYVNVDTGGHLADHVGRCDREIECGYHYTPKQFFEDNPVRTASAVGVAAASASGSSSNNAINNVVSNVDSTVDRNVSMLPKETFQRKYSLVPKEFLERSLAKGQPNNFLDFLKTRFGNVAVDNVEKRYHIGTSKHWPAATVFWQVDCNNQVRTGKVMLYDSTGHRVKKPYDHVDWVHSILCKKGLLTETFQLNQCLFGEHQIRNGNVREIVLVESEKTAVIASLYLPQYTWMACGGLSMLSAKRCETVKRFPIILYPDLKALGRWEGKAAELRNIGFKISVSDLLDKCATDAERDGGLDLADYLLQNELPKSDLERLIEKNPLVKDLVDRLDLEQ